MSVLQFLQDNGAWIAAAATLVMAIMVFLQTKESRRLYKENRKLSERACILELGGQIIQPLSECAAKVADNWSRLNTDILSCDRYLIFGQFKEEFKFNQNLYEDLRGRESSLTSDIERYDTDV